MCGCVCARECVLGGHACPQGEGVSACMCVGGLVCQGEGVCKVVVLHACFFGGRCIL